MPRSLWGPIACAAVISCGGGDGDVTAFVGATVFDGTGADAIPNATMVVEDGRIVAVGVDVAVPAGAERVDLSGRYVVPGLINAHGHVGDTRGLETGHYTEENLLRQLRLYADYGVTTIVSLGGDAEAGVRLRDAQDAVPPGRARLYVAGTVVTGDTPEEAVAVVDANEALGADFVKFRVDDNLGTTAKMAPEVWQAVIDAGHAHGRRVAAHLFYLDDAKALVRGGVDVVAHSVRDVPVDDELIGLLTERNVCYTPTLTREVSTFVYESRPPFFDDPFFTAHADSAVTTQLLDPARQRRMRESASAQRYKAALEVAKANLGRLARAGVTIAMGTDTGPPARFQGYFEHLELALMADAGLSPEQIILSATRNAAACYGLDEVGTLEPGRWADFVAVGADPLQDVSNLRDLVGVWVGGEEVTGGGM